MTSFIQTGEIKALAGVDFLTISPALLEELKNDTSPVPKKLDAVQGTSATYLVPFIIILTISTAASADPLPKVSYIDNEPEFRWALCDDEMATDKLNEGIRKFAQDGETLKTLLRKKLSA